MPENDQRRYGGENGSAPRRPRADGAGYNRSGGTNASGVYAGRSRASFEVEEFEPEAPAPRPRATQTRTSGTAQTRASGMAQIRTSGTAQTRTAGTTQTRTAGTAQTRTAGTAQTRTAGTAQTRTAGTAQTRTSGTAQTRAAGTAQTRTSSTAQTRASGMAQTRAAKPVARPAPEQQANEWDAAQKATRAPRKSQLPEWARLALTALVLVGLIFGVGHIITNSGTQQDRTVIRPLVSGTDTPAPGDDAQQVVSTNVETDNVETNSVPANPGNATVSPTNMPDNWNSAVATSQPVNIPEGELRRATIRMAGDVIVEWEMLQGSYDKATDRYDFSPYFELMNGVLSNADYTMINIEASLRKGKYGYSGYPQFTTPPVILQTLRSQGVDMITMCNNHMLDGYCDGIVESVSYVNDARLDHIGGYTDQEDSETPEIYEINGIKVGFVTYTQVTNDMEYKSDDRVNYLVHYFKRAKFKDDVDKARAAGAEVIVAVAHWGSEYKRAPDSSTVSYAKQMAAAGVDVIIGGHPHMVQPAEYITATDASGNTRTALCVYSLGNFLSQHIAQYTDSGIVFEFTIQENTDGSFSIVSPGYVPVFVWKWPMTDANGKTVMGTTKSREDKVVYNLRVLPIALYMENPPAGMDSEQYSRMRECWFETLEVMNNSSVIQVLAQ